jgi:hypothetical protein
MDDTVEIDEKKIPLGILRPGPMDTVPVILHNISSEETFDSHV